MKLFNVLLIVMLLFLCAAILGCGSAGEGKGNVGVCEKCDSNADCETGLTCQSYSNGTTFITFCSDGRKVCQ